MNKTVQFKNYFLKLLIISFFIISTLTSCGIYKKSDARKVSPNADERVKQNIAEMSSFYIALTSMIIGVQLFLAGFIGELISRNSQERNNYQVEKEI